MQKSKIYERLSVYRRTKFKKVMLDIVSIFFSKAPNKIDGKRSACEETLNEIKVGNNEILIFLIEYVYSTVNSTVLQSIFTKIAKISKQIDLLVSLMNSLLYGSELGIESV